MASLQAHFLTLYGVFRFGIEFFREPDVHQSFFFDQVKMGQILCVPMMLVGTVVMVWCFRCKPWRNNSAHITLHGPMSIETY